MAPPRQSPAEQNLPKTTDGRRRLLAGIPARMAPAILLAMLVAVLGAGPAAAWHRHHFGHFHGHGHPHHGPYYGYGYPYGPVPVYPPVAPLVVYGGPAVPALPAATLPVPAVPPAPASGCLVVREYTTEIKVGGETVEGYGYACLQADGSWLRGAPAPVPTP